MSQTNTLAQLDFLAGKRSSLEDSIAQTKRNLDDKRTERAIDTKELTKASQSIEVYQKLMTALSEQGKESLERLIQDGLNLVFHDRKYLIQIELTDQRDIKNLTFYLIETIDGQVVKSNIKDSVGGAIKSVVSVVIQLFFITYYGAERVLFLDEAFSDVHVKYRVNLFQLLKSFISQAGFKILMVTHETSIAEFADQIYEVKDGVYALKEQ